MIPGVVGVKLVLHFDVNETIILSDIAGGDTFSDSLNKVLAKNAFVQIPNEQQHNKPLNEIEPLFWKDGTKLIDTLMMCDDEEEQSTNNNNDEEEGSNAAVLMSSSSSGILHTDWHWPEGCCPYYKTSYKNHAKTFTEHHGRQFKHIYNQMEMNMRIPKDLVANIDQRLLVAVSDDNNNKSKDTNYQQLYGI